MKRIAILFRDVARPQNLIQEIQIEGKSSLNYVEKYVTAIYYVGIMEGDKIIKAFPFYNPTKDHLIKAQKILSGNKLYNNQLKKMIGYMGIEV